MKKALAWQQLQSEAVAKALEERELEHVFANHLVLDMQHCQESMKITLAEHEKVLEGVKKVMPEQHANIKSMKLDLLYPQNCLESMNTTPVEKQEELDQSYDM